MIAVTCLSACALMSLSVTTPPPAAIDLFELLRQGSITATAEGLGGHEGGCVSLSLMNLTGSSLIAEIRPGTLLVSGDSSLQDLMIVRREQVELAPFAKGTVTCRAFCVESDDGAPGEKSAFAVARMADTLLVRLAEHVHGHGYGDEAVQQAVWVISNGHTVSEVAGDDLSAALPLRTFVAGLTGVELPWYTRTHVRPSEPGQVYSNEAARITGEVEFALNTHALITILIKDDRQRTVRVMGHDRNLGPGRYTIEIDLVVQGWTSGAYTVQFVQDGSNVLKKVPFTI